MFQAAVWWAWLAGVLCGGPGSGWLGLAILPAKLENPIRPRQANREEHAGETARGLGEGRLPEFTVHPTAAHAI